MSYQLPAICSVLPAPCSYSFIDPASRFAYSYSSASKFRTESSIILMTHSSLLIVSLFFLGLAFLVSPTFGAQPTLEPILLGYPSPALTELPNYLAVKKGFYTEEGLDIKFVRARSNILVAALFGGSLDYITSVTSSVGGIIGGAPVKILAGVIKNNP